MSANNPSNQLDGEHSLTPSEAISKVRRMHNRGSEDDDLKELDDKEWEEHTKINDIQEHEWVLTEIEYCTTSEEKQDVEFLLDKEIQNQSVSNPFEVDEVTVYDDISTEACTVCGGEGISACETCGGDGEMDCRKPNCRDGQVYVDCECFNGEALDDCPECMGRGQRFSNGYEKKCRECNGSGEVYKTHTLCGGEGRRAVGECELCTNNPPIGKLGVVECEDCSSPEHENTCNNCEGEKTTTQGTRIDRSYNNKTKRTVEDNIPEYLFKYHSDSVTVNEYNSDSIPEDEEIDEDIQLAEDYRIFKKRLKGYDIDYSFDDRRFESTVIDDSIHGTIPRVSETTTILSTVTGIALFALWLGGFIYIIESPTFEHPLWLTANFLIGIPASFFIWVMLDTALPGMKKYQVESSDV